jgi:hypothetical protein
LVAWRGDVPPQSVGAAMVIATKQRALTNLSP